MARVTPPPGATGLFQLRLPFEAKPTLSYTVGAIRSFAEMISQGDDPMKMVYTPNQLTQADYAADQEAGAYVITLMTPSQLPLYVPDTYIVSYPNMGTVPHSEVVLCVPLGILPDTYDLTRAIQACQNAVEDDCGITTVVTAATIPTVDVVTQAQAVAAQAARAAAIKNKTTYYSQTLFLQEQIVNYKANEAAFIQLIEQLQDRIDELEGSAPGT